MTTSTSRNWSVGLERLETAETLSALDLVVKDLPRPRELPALDPAREQVQVLSHRPVPDVIAIMGGSDP